MNRNRFHKFIQAMQTGGPAYAAHKVKLYVKHNLRRERKFSWEDYRFEELPETKDTPKDSDNKFDVSVVVPTYNGGTQFETMLQLLKQQKSCGSVELVIVDSGSTDGTVELCYQYGVTLVQITQEQFSHSYARNLGAETACGTILVFMTQDALPSSERWLSEMIAPVLAGEADAVSCSEECPEGTDLYYRILNYGHASFVGTLHEDVSGSKEKCRNKENLRRYASLSDVACAIKRSTFFRFRHRYDFAEDLDLGIRLLSCGYRTKLLSKTRVIHGHNRNADYYLKRAVVEQEAFTKIFPERIENEKTDAIVSKIYYSACLVTEYISKLEVIDDGREISIEKFVEQASELFEKIRKEAEKLTEFRQVNCESANLLEEIVQLCANKSRLRKYPENWDLAYSVRFYLDNIAEYFVANKTKAVDVTAAEICMCMMKQFSLCVGMELVKLKQDEKWNQKILELIKGV